MPRLTDASHEIPNDMKMRFPNGMEFGVFMALSA
jgi:hypothetical protein